ncbi:MAG: ketol-acid reductoisomerase [Chloroflexi bacterium]|nr:ketol-acid reductoisomerase [Chloroflexota bacterium]
MSKIYFDNDADLSFVEDMTIAILGYGNQGRSQALNLRDSGLEVIVGSREDSSAAQAREDGFPVFDWAEASARAQIIFLLIPDEIMPQFYAEYVEPGLNEHDMLVFASGYNIFYGFLRPSPTSDVVMLAPRMIGHGVRNAYLEGQGFPSLIAIEQDASGQAFDRLLALSKGIGTTRMGAVLSSFEEETVVDLFSEHLSPLYAIRRNFEALVEAGYDPWVIILELYASGEGVEINKAYVEQGLWDQITTHSRTSQFGQEVYGRLSPQADAAEKTRLHNIIARIKDGRFAKEWALEQQASEPTFQRIRAENLKHPIIQAEQELYKLLGRRKVTKE